MDTQTNKPHSDKNSGVWNKIISRDEEVQYEFSVGTRYTNVCLMLWGIVSLLLLFTGLSIIGILAFLAALFYFKFYLPKANVYGFTNKRVLIHRGWLSTNTISIDYSKITDVYVSESLFEKMLTHTGTLSINTAGSNGKEIALSRITTPYVVKKELDALKDK